ncbi:MAG: Ig-like domain-containing protein [Eubacteriales bacterium]|nr:Ig-like domain-containing protein [Eubacteriales bacterium]
MKKRLTAFAVFFMLLLSMNIFVSAAKVTISTESATILVGEKVKLSVKVNGKKKKAVWSSSDTGVATVNSKGQVTGKAAGSAYITAKVKGKTKKCLVSVLKKDATYRYNVLILDMSGSMRKSPDSAQRVAAKRFCARVLSAEGTNYVAVVALNSRSPKMCDFTNNYETLAKCIDRQKISGRTNMNAALETAGNLLASVRASGGNIQKNIILCSDGLPTLGTSAKVGHYTRANHKKKYKFANSCYTTAERLKNKGYFIYALGFFHNAKGNNLTFGKQLMKDLASRDKYYIIQDSNDLSEIFDTISDTIVNVTLNKTALSMYIGDTAQLYAMKNGSETKAAWTSSDSSVASVDDSGKIRALKIGKAVITGTVDGKKATCTVTVASKAAITLTPKKLSLTIGETAQLTAKVTGTPNKAQFTSSNNSIVSVSSTGKVLATGAGSAHITASVDGVSATCAVTVKAPPTLLFGDAVRLPDGSVRLTESKTWQGGSFWTEKAVNTSRNFEVNFSYYAGDGEWLFSGYHADGILLNFTYERGLGDEGGGLGFVNRNDSYGVEFDSYPLNSGDPEEPHIAIIQESISNHLKYVADKRVDDAVWHKVKVVYNRAGKKLSVYMDGSSAALLSCTGVDLVEECYIGLSAATGSGVNVQKVKDFSFKYR